MTYPIAKTATISHEGIRRKSGDKSNQPRESVDRLQNLSHSTLFSPPKKSEKNPANGGSSRARICLHFRVPGQLRMLQALVWTGCPKHGFPPFIGTGFVQVRMRRWKRPLPHVFEQGPNPLHGLYPPSTVENNKYKHSHTLLKAI